MIQHRHVPPKASAMFEALRGLGYTTAAALADLIDNSITALASQVEITFTWDGQYSQISVLDDGQGMDSNELERAMRLGGRSPLEARPSHDLGRFGMGLKTASFSQCRRLSVSSKKNQVFNCLCWDLDVLAAVSDDGWYLLECTSNASEDVFLPLHSLQHGTLVLWESLDRIITPGFTDQDFLDLLDRVEQHLAMVFHRYLDGARPRLRISINGRPIVPWTPFLPHPATWSSPVEVLPTNYGMVTVQCHVLPHKDHLDRNEYERAAGPEGWTGQQGFYVYRNERLLVAGSWLGLGQGRSWTKEEAHRLARIRLDITNSADSEWKIDIRKSIAKPPLSLRLRLTKLAEDTRARARRVFAHRGSAVTLVGRTEPLAHAWRTEHLPEGIRYRIDEEHPAIRSVLEDAGPMGPQIKAMLRIIEETVPVQRIWLDTTEDREVPRIGFSCDPPADVLKVLKTVYKSLVCRKGMAPKLAREQLLRTEPFNNYHDLVTGLPEEPDTEE
jgi:hypothetical protein